MELATELLSAFREQLRQASTLSLDRDEPLEVMIGVPANANSNQRFLTAEAFRAAGFHVLGMLNEPSAASVEFGHRERVPAQGTAATVAAGVRPRWWHLRRVPGRNWRR